MRPSTIRFADGADHLGLRLGGDAGENWNRSSCSGVAGRPPGAGEGETFGAEIDTAIGEERLSWD